MQLRPSYQPPVDSDTAASAAEALGTDVEI